MIDSIHLTPQENQLYSAAFTATLNATNSYVKAKEAGLKAVEDDRRNQRLLNNARAVGE